MREYKAFVDNLKSLKARFSNKRDSQWKGMASSAIDGLASSELRNLVPLKDRRSSGAFFTDTKLGSEVLSMYNLTFGNQVIFFDPACGAGNLLISVKDHFEKPLSEKNIKLRVFGTDIHNEFIEAAKLRLSIYDLLNNTYQKDYFENFTVSDGLLQNNFYQIATHIVTNPPFNQLDSPTNIKWARGKVSAAALFMDVIINNVNPGTEIIAILPDVLRSGSRYLKWREHISKYCYIGNVKLLGQFDKYTDVDVFSVMLKKRIGVSEKTTNVWSTLIENKTKVSDYFNVSVGSVVDNRDPHEGVQRPYLISRGLEGWTDLKDTNLTRKYKGKAIKPPFVVIKRTSRHGDRYRAIAILVTISEPVYVDNHLIVLKPLKGGVKTCKKLLKLLKRQSTSEWLNNQIRCRHLTVKVVAQIPFFDI